MTHLLYLTSLADLLKAASLIRVCSLLTLLTFSSSSSSDTQQENIHLLLQDS